MVPWQRAVLLATYALYLFTVVIAAFWNHTSSTTLVIPALATWIGTLIIPILFYRDDFGWFHPLVFGSLLALKQCIRSFSDYAYGLESNMGLPSLSEEELGKLMAHYLVLLAVGQIAYYFGFFGSPAFERTSIKLREPRAIGCRILLVFVVCFAVLGVFLVRQGGIAGNLLHLSKGRAVVISEGEVYLGGYILCSRLAFMACLVWFVATAASLRNVLVWVSVGLSMVFLYCTAGSRSAPILAVMCILCGYVLRRRRIPVLVSVTLAGFIVVFIGWGRQVRNSSWTGNLSFGEASPEAAGQFFSEGAEELANRSGKLNPVLPILSRVPSEVDYLYGKSYLSVLFAPVPRALWPGKPRTTGALVGPTFFDNPAGMPPSPIGEAYWNLGVFGVLLVFALYGVFHKWLVAFYRRNAGTSGGIAFLCVSLIYLQPDVLGFTTWVQHVSMLGLVLLVIGAFSRHPDHPPLLVKTA